MKTPPTLALLISFAFPAYAETYFCTAEAGAGVESGGPSGIKAMLADVSQSKFVQTKERGKWIVKEHGKDYALFNQCASPYFCEHSGGYAGVFMRKDDGTFSVTWINIVDKREILIVAKGRCSKL